MVLRERLNHVGDFFFRWRSYTPVSVILIFLLERNHFFYPKGSHLWDFVYELSALSISMIGLAVRILTTGFARPGTSGRNTKRQKADVLNTTGMYSIIRNPLYLGNYICWFGISLLAQTWEVIVLNTFIFFLFYLPIIHREESFLEEKFGDEFRKYAERVPSFTPSFKNYIAPDRKFDLKRVLRMEHDSFFAVIASFATIELMREYTVLNKIELNEVWTGIIVGSLVFWVTVKALKRKTKLLKS